MPNTDHDNRGKIVAEPDGHPRRCRSHHAGHEGTP